jgi:hypothetical protein
MWEEFQALLDSDRTDGEFARSFFLRRANAAHRSCTNVLSPHAHSEWSGAFTEEVRRACQEIWTGRGIQSTTCAWSCHRGRKGRSTGQSFLDPVSRASKLISFARIRKRMLRRYWRYIPNTEKLSVALSERNLDSMRVSTE